MSALDTLFSGVTVVTMNESLEVLFGGFLGVTDGKIAYIGKAAPKELPKTVIDGAGMVLLPGLINCHTTLATTALRNYTDDAANRDALEALLQKEEKMDARCAKAAALLGIAECLRFGVTSVSDLYYYPEATAQAVAETGIKANLALSAYRFEDESEPFDFETDAQCREISRVAEKWHGFDGGRIRIDAGLYAEYTGNYKLWEGLAAFAAERGLRFQTRLSRTRQEVDACLARTGLTPGELLACHNVFAVPASAVGCGALTSEELSALGRRGVTAVAVPIADGMAGFPPAPVRRCAQAGMNVALGTGGAQECGSLDLFEAMRALSRAERTAYGEADAFGAQAALMLATVCGARAQGRERECGMLKEGMDADLILVDFTAPHLLPCHNVFGGLVYGAKGADVALTMVRGKILYRSGEFSTIDLKAAVAELTAYAIPRLFAQNDA